MNGINKLIWVIPSLLCLICIWSACNSAKKIEVELKPAKKIIAASGVFQAGAAKIDITPPPGYPMAGYSLAGKLSRGWWTRLYAKSIYLEDGKGNRLALVSCDLQGIPAGLADKVAELVAAKIPSPHPDSAYIGKEQIILAATHTHNGPGNFFTSPAYNAQASPLSGFDDVLFGFLARKIALSITTAIESKKPALIKKGVMDLPGLSRNRSLAAFERNPAREKDEILRQVSNPQAFFTSDLPASVPSVRALQAVDPKLTILKIEAQDGATKAPIAVAAFFAVHPTAMGPETEVYSSDIFGVAAALVEQYLRNHFSNEPGVVAIFNGAEGDISPNWKKQNRENTLNIGEGLAKGILKALALAKEPVSGEISYRYEVVGIAEKRVEDLHGEAANLCPSDQPLQTAKEPYPGVATFGGAEDGRTIFYQYGFREGYRAENCDPDTWHGYKFSALNKLLDIVLPKDKNELLHTFVSKIGKEMVKVPGEIPLGVYSMGPLVLVSLPGEFTVALGSRIIQAVQEATKSETVLLVGPANEYLSYFTTPSEYNAQHYEGASTMYGQVAGPFVEQELTRIARFPKNTANYKLNKTYDVGPSAARELGRISPNDPWLLDEALKNLLEEGTGIQRHFPQFIWWDKSISLSDGLDTMNPVVSIEQKTSQGWKPLYSPSRRVSRNEKITVMECDTTSLNFVTVIDSVSNNLSRLRTVWMVSFNKDNAQTARFSITTPRGTTIRSEAFKIEEVLKGNKLILVSPPE